MGEVSEKSLRDMIRGMDLLWFCPKGWLYQNMAVIARLEQWPIDCVDLKQQRIYPRKADDFGGEVEKVIRAGRNSPYVFWAAIAIPNATKASQVLAKNQTLANMALIACALERHRKAAGAYPETLDALAPRFLDKLPHDIVNGEPLKYQHTPEDKYRLYSVGWDLKDDTGAAAATNTKASGSNSSGEDWVWNGQRK